MLFDLIKEKDPRLVFKAAIFFLTLLYRRCSLKVLHNFLIDHPTNVHVLATTRCNRRCDGCVYSDLLNEKRGDTFLSLENLSKILDSRLFSNAIWVSVKGGEPLLHKGLAQIIRTIKEKKVFVSLTTNADFFSRDILEQLHAVGLNWINISYYKDNAHKIREVASWARSGVYDINRISVYKHALQRDEIEAACRFTQEAGIKHFYFGTFNDYSAKIIDVDGIKKNVKTLETLYAEMRAKYTIDIEMIPTDAHSFLFSGKGAPYCYSGISYMTVAPDLSVAPCCILEPEKKWGDINDFAASLQFKKSLHSGDTPAICKRCSYLVKR